MTDSQFFKSRGLCPMCCSAKLAPGRAMCFDCLEKNRAKSAKRREALSDEQRRVLDGEALQHKKALYERRKAAGLCVGCGKPALPGHVYCLEHNCRNTLRGREIRAAKRREKPVGACYRCNTQAEPGYKLCAAHLAQLRERSEKGRQNGREAVRRAHEYLWKGLRCDRLGTERDYGSGA